MNTELQTWLNGTPTGGPNADGRYPLTAKDGQVFLVYCPAAQALNPTLAEQPVEIFASQAQTAADSATTAASDADADRIAAQTAAANAAQSESNALASKNAAATSATNASTSATNAATSETNANAAKTAAETARTGSESARDKALLWADAAENTVVEGTSYSAKHWANKAAASAASINPSNYATASHGHDLASASANGFMSSAQFNKLAGVADNANNYVHPASHPPSIIAQDASNRFVTDAEKSAWNGKQAALGYTAANKAGEAFTGSVSAAGFLTAKGSTAAVTIEDRTTTANTWAFYSTSDVARIDASAIGDVMRFYRDKTAEMFRVNILNADGTITHFNYNGTSVNHIRGWTTFSQKASFANDVDVYGNNGIKVRSSQLGSGLDIGASPSLAGGTDPDVYLYQRNNGAIWVGTNNTLRGKIQANGNLDWEHRVHAKGIVGGISFNPYDANLWRPAFLATGSYGGGFVMYDGNLGSGVWMENDGGGVGMLVLGPGTTNGLFKRAVITNSAEQAVITYGRGWYRHEGVSAGAWYSDTANNKKFFVGLYDDNNFGVYNTAGGWAWAVAVDGRTKVKDANSATLRTQPRHFVQSTDPGAAMADGDIWYQT